MENRPQPFGPPPRQPEIAPIEVIETSGPRGAPQPHPAPMAQQGPPMAQPVQIIQQFRSSILFRVFAWLGWAGFFFAGVSCLGMMVGLADYFDTTEGLQEKFHSGAQFAGKKIAIIDVDGVIMDGDGFVKRQIDRVRSDSGVKAVVVRVNSPGGTVTGSDYILHHLNKLRADKKIPVVVSMGGVAASGGYYVSMAVGDEKDSIFAEPTTTTGSIGVVVPHYNISGLLRKHDVIDDSISSHPRKEMLSMTKEMSEEHRKLIEGYVQESFDRFKEIVKSGRPKFRQDDAALTALATGEIFSAGKAKDNGLVDKIGFLEDAVDRALELAKLKKSETRVVRFERPVSLFDLGGVARAPDAGQSHLAALFELSTPRAYYLHSTLPVLSTSRRAD